MVKQHPADTKRSSLFMDSFQTRTSGKGRMDIYQVFPGIHLSLNLFLADQVSFRHNADQHILEISIAGLLFIWEVETSPSRVPTAVPIPLWRFLLDTARESVFLFI